MVVSYFFVYLDSVKGNIVNKGDTAFPTVARFPDFSPPLQPSTALF